MCVLRRRRTAALSRPRDGHQQRRHAHHTRRPVDDHRRLQRPHLDRSVAVLPIHRSHRSANVADRELVAVCDEPDAAAPPARRRGLASIVGRSVQRYDLLQLIL